MGYFDRDAGEWNDNDSTDTSETRARAQADRAARAGDAYSRNYQAMGDYETAKWKAAEPRKPGSLLGNIVKGVFTRGGSIPGTINAYSKYNKWERSNPEQYTLNDRNNPGRSEASGRKADIYGGTGVVGGYGSAVGGSGSGMGSGTGTGGTGNSLYPSVYTDPITGRLVYQSQSVGNMTNSAFADQQMLDQIMGSDVASQNRNQQIQQLQDYLAYLKPMGVDTTYYEHELARLQGLGQGTAPGGGLMPYLNTGVQEQAANRQLEMEARNQMLAQQEAAARRGTGVLGAPMTDQLRASLGLSTATARAANKAKAQTDAWNRRNQLMAYLKQSQQQDYAQETGRGAMGLTMGDWENQRKIAEISQANTNKQYKDMVDAKKSGDIWGAVGQIGGNIDWGSIF